MQILEADQPSTVCFPEKGIKNDQGVRVVIKYLKDNPAKLHENEILLIMLAYANAYPCL